MSREVKRVALDFDWPMKKTWKGYLNPYYKECPKCNGSGVTTAYQRLEDLVNLLMLSGSDAKKKECHPYFNNIPFHHTENIYPSEDMVELTEGLAGRNMSFIMGHDACDRWSAENKIIKAAGLPKSWGYCKICDGEGIDSTIKEKFEAWKKYEPPKGNGWQMWETTSEGSPMSPVFKTPEELARWLTDNNASTFGHSTTDYDTWLNMIKTTGHAISGVMVNGKVMSGVEALNEIMQEGEIENDR